MKDKKFLPVLKFAALVFLASFAYDAADNAKHEWVAKSLVFAVTVFLLIAISNDFQKQAKNKGQ